MVTSSRVEAKQTKSQKKGKTIAIIEHDLGSDSGDDTKIRTMGLKGNSMARTISSNCSNITQDEDTRIELFHIRGVSKIPILIPFLIVGHKLT